MKTKKDNKNSLKELMQTFLTGILEHAGENLALRAHRWITRFKRRAIGSVLLAVGITFFLNGVAVYINSITNNLFPWIGYGAIGFITIFVGYILLKE